MKLIETIVVFDAVDMSAESTFWSLLLEGNVEMEDDWHTVYVGGRPRVAVQLAPDHIRPEWPHGTPQQIHLDLHVDDLASAHAEVVSLGATVLQAAEDPGAESGFQVYADPAGHPFCLCWGE